MLPKRKYWVLGQNNRIASFYGMFGCVESVVPHRQPKHDS